MNQKNKFFYSIIVPTILAITMFVVSFYAVIIPLFEDSMMDRKKEMIMELTNTARSVLVEFNEAYKSGSLSLGDAQNKAAKEIGQMRYGKEQKDYFWIINSGPEMIMHPYRTELIGNDLSDYTDNHENKLFVDAVKLVDKEGEGIIQYYWQWKDDASRVEPKLSYVKGFMEWGWIIGTGIYLEDVKAEIKQLKRQLLKISFFIIVIIIIILVYILQQTKLIEEKRRKAEHELLLSIQRYKSLVDASTESTLMLVDQKVVFANMKFMDLLNDKHQSVIGSDFASLFEIDWDNMVTRITNPQKTYAIETNLTNGKAGKQNIVISVTKVTQNRQTGYIVVVKPVTEQNRIRLDAKKMADDVQLSLQLMNQPVRNLVKPNINCNLRESIEYAAGKMSDHHTNLICIREEETVIGVVNDRDLRERVLSRNLSTSGPVAAVMTAPVKVINENALLYEAMLVFQKESISHILVENNNHRIIGNISYQQCLEMQRNSLTHLIQEINQCSLISDIKNIYNKVPILIQAVFTSTDNINSVSRIITSIADAINIRILEMALKEVGPAPCEFAFIAMGSEGRREQTLKTDQDNAVIFADDSEENKSYFLKLSEIINEHLHEIGYSRCKGDLMAGNPEWCNNLEEWKNLFTNWINNPEMANVLDSSIFFDLRLIYGSEKLVNELLDHVHIQLEENSVFFIQLAKTVTRKRPVINKKNVNIKDFLTPIVGYLRVRALANNIRETNSLLRLDQMVGRGILQDMKAEGIEKIYQFLMHLRIKWQVTLLLDNDYPDNTILLKNLTAIELTTLKKIVSEISILQDELKSTFKLSEG